MLNSRRNERDREKEREREREREIGRERERERAREREQKGTNSWVLSAAQGSLSIDQNRKMPGLLGKSSDGSRAWEAAFLDRACSEPQTEDQHLGGDQW